jgi:glycosyltransferase involved in cell wall biosynthesis
VKVLHVAPSIEQSYGGPTQSLAGYAVASRTAGIDVSIAAPRCPQGDLDEFRQIAGPVDLHLFPSIGSGGFVTSPDLVAWVRKRARQYDVVHVHGLFNPTSSLSARTAIAGKTPTVIRPFGTLSKYTFYHRRTPLKHVWFSRIERPNLSAARAIHFTTERERSEAEWHRIDFSGRTFVVPPPSLDSRPPGAAAAHSDDGIVLFIGRINPIKNLEVLVDAWPLVRAKSPDLLLEIVGDGDETYVNSLRERVRQKGVDSSVMFHGFLRGEAKEKALGRARVFVLPSHHENFGIAALEAIAKGIPVVLSQEVQLADFVERELLGKITEATPASLAASILEVSANKSLIESVRTRGADVVSANFSPAAIGQQLSNMYLAVTEPIAEHASI